MDLKVIVRDSWSEIENWLSHNVPHYIEGLKDGALEGQLDWFKKNTGIVLPEDFLESYRIYDGQTNDGYGLFDGWHFLSWTEIYNEWKSCEGYDDEFDTMKIHGPLKMRYMSKLYVPFAADFSGNYLGIDLDPPADGSLGQVVNYGRDEDDRYVLASSFAEFLYLLARDLQNDAFIIGEDGCLSHKENLIAVFGKRFLT